MDRSTGEAVVLYLYTGEVSGGQALSEVAQGSLAKSLGAGETQVDGGVFGLSPCVVARVASVGMPAAQPAMTPGPPVFSAPPPAAAPCFGERRSFPDARRPFPVAAERSRRVHGHVRAATAGIGVPPKSAPVPITPAVSRHLPEARRIGRAKGEPGVQGMGEFTRLFRAADALPPGARSRCRGGCQCPSRASEARGTAPGVFTSLCMAANSGMRPRKPNAEPAPVEPATCRPRQRRAPWRIH